MYKGLLHRIHTYFFTHTYRYVTLVFLKLYAMTGSCAKLHTGSVLICTHYYSPLSLFPSFPFIVRGYNIILVTMFPHIHGAWSQMCLHVLTTWIVAEPCTHVWNMEMILSHGTCACFGVSFVSSHCEVVSDSLHY